MSCNVEDLKIDLQTSTSGDFVEYDKKTKEKFYSDFVYNKVYRNGKRISAGFSEKEIEACYEHITTKGEMDKTRYPDLRRYECIYILKHILSNPTCLQCPNFMVWKKKEKYLKEKIFCPQTGYLIILAERKSVYKFVSAYFIGSKKKKARLQKEFEVFSKKI